MTSLRSRLLYVLFLVSGTAGLIYQVVWSILLKELFGVSVYAVTTVMATFLGGLALGGWWLGRVVDRRQNPLRFYGLLELGIAVAAVAGTLTLRAFDPLHIAAANRLSPDSLGLILVRAALASIVVLPATVMMGGTLPAMTRVFVGRVREVGRELSLLYALNTLGAVLGALAAGFALIRWLGLHATLAVGIVTNVIVGLLSLILAARWHAAPAEASPDDEQPAVPIPAVRNYGLLIVAALSGFVSLGLEVLWTRMLILRIGTTTYAFVTVLASFLIGISLGSFAVRALSARIQQPRRWFGWIQVGIAASSVATLPLLGSATLQGWMTGRGADWLLLIALRFGVSFLIMLVPATLIGMTFPLAGRIWTREIGRLGRDLGQVYGANTLGNVVGAVASGFVLLPLVGLQRSIVALAGLSLINAGWGLTPAAGRRMLPSFPITAALAGCVLLSVLWHPGAFTAWDERAGDATLYYNEGVVATVKVLERGGSRRFMTVDGITIGQSYGGVDAKQQALAHFPFLLLPDALPRQLLSIGLGTGVLIGEAARHPEVERIDCLELSPSVVEAARLFDRFNGGILDDSRANVTTDDGVNFLRRSTQRYDAIISDAKSRRAHSGNSAFFSEDYYRLCREHLAPSALMVQWVPLDVPHFELKMILRTFAGVFPHVYTWVAPPHSLFLVGTQEPLTLDLDHIGRLFDDPVTANLRRYGWGDAAGFASLLTLGRDAVVQRVGGDGPVNTLEHPVLEFYSHRDYAIPPSVNRAANLELLLPAGVGLPDGVRLRGTRELPASARDATARHLRAAVMVERNDRAQAEQAISLLVQAIEQAPDLGLLRRAAVGSLQRALRLVPDSAEAHAALGSLLHAQGRVAEAEVHLVKAVEIDPGNATGHHGLGVIVASRGDLTTAERRLRLALKSDPDNAAMLRDLGRVLFSMGQLDDALEALARADWLRPDDAATLDGMAQVWLRRDPQRAVGLAERAAEISGNRQLAVLVTLSDAHAAVGQIDRARDAAERGLGLARAAGDTTMAQELGRRLERYRQAVSAP